LITTVCVCVCVYIYIYLYICIYLQTFMLDAIIFGIWGSTVGVAVFINDNFLCNDLQMRCECALTMFANLRFIFLQVLQRKWLWWRVRYSKWYLCCSISLFEWSFQLHA